MCICEEAIPVSRFPSALAWGTSCVRTAVRYSCRKRLTSRASVCILPRQLNAIRSRQGACYPACWVVNNTEISYMETADSRQYLFMLGNERAARQASGSSKASWDKVPSALHRSRCACPLPGCRHSIHRSQSIADSLGSYPRGRESQ